MTTKSYYKLQSSCAYIGIIGHAAQKVLLQKKVNLCDHSQRLVNIIYNSY